MKKKIAKKTYEIFKAIVSRLRRETIADRISSFVSLKVDEKKCVERFLCGKIDGEGWERSYAWNVFV